MSANGTEKCTQEPLANAGARKRKEINRRRREKLESMVRKSVKGIKIKDRFRKGRKRRNGRRKKSKGSRKKNTSIVTGKKFTNGIDLLSKSRARRGKKNKIINRRRRKKDKTRVLRSKVISKKFKGHRNSPKTREIVSAGPKKLSEK